MAGMIGVIRQDGHAGSFDPIEVPLAKMSGGIAGVLEDLGKGFFLKAQSFVQAGAAYVRSEPKPGSGSKLVPPHKSG